MTKQTKSAPTAAQLAAIANEDAAKLHAMRHELAAQALAAYMKSHKGQKELAIYEHKIDKQRK